MRYNSPMALDDDTCFRAMLARDRRFEGRFVIAVRTTGVYCRPGCPARMPARANVSFYTHPAAAERGGYRPCLRCRPETAPGSPAWAGTSATVARALRLIEEGAIERDGVDGLATRLGVTDRWLRKLFDAQLGASPLEVARTRRVHFARRLLDEAELSLEDVAAASGFGSARRLHDAIRATFHRSPRELRARRAARGTRSEGPDVAHELRLPARPPFDAAPLFGFFAARAIPGVETASADTYRRAVTLDGEAGVLEVRAVDGPRPGVTVRWTGASPRHLLAVATRVGRLFDLDADVREVGAVLTRDPVLAARWPKHGIRVPGAWDPFEAAVRALLGQQVSVAAARTLAGRLVARCGTPLAGAARGAITHLFPTPAQVAGADLDAMGLTGARVAALRSLARAVADGSVELSAADGLDAFVERLSALPGIGPWSAHYLAMRALGEPDAFPAGDLGVRKALATGERLPSERDVIARAERWRPWRAYAVLALWTGHAPEPRRVPRKPTTTRRAAASRVRPKSSPTKRRSR